MNNCENNNKNFVFSYSQILFRNKTAAFEMQLIKEHLYGDAIATTYLQVS